MRVKITFQEEVLGSTPGDPEIAKTYVLSNAPDAKTLGEEIEAQGTEKVIEKAKTIFPKQEGKPFVWDYQIKGMFKDYCSMLRRVPKTKSQGLKAYQKVIDGLVFVNPRRILFNIPEGAKIGDCQRPLRAMTMQGERVSLANSETIPKKSSIEFDVHLLDVSLEPLVEEWLNYGALRGFGQWRNSGKGRYSWEKIAEK